MEIELKYLIDDDTKIDQMFEDPMISEIKDEKTEESINMDAIYFDTEDHSLTNEGIAFRVRMEGERYIATLKWNGTSENGMHKREEINIPVTDMNAVEHPTYDIFAQSEMADVLETVIGTKELKPLMEVAFVRRQVRLDSGKSISVFSVDNGEVSAGGKKESIRELEIELYSGSEDDMRAFGERVREKFGLVPGNKSKFERGYELFR